MKTALITLISLASIGCAHWYSEDVSTINVQVLRGAPLPQETCAKLSQVEGLSYWDTYLAMLDLKRNASYLEATHVLLTEKDFGFWRQIYRGDAYKCEGVVTDARFQEVARQSPLTGQ